MYNCHAILNNFGIRGGGKSGIHLAEVSVFAGMTGKNRHFRNLSQQVLSGVVAVLMKKPFPCFLNVKSSFVPHYGS